MPRCSYLFIADPTNVPRRIHNMMKIEQEDMSAANLPEFTKTLASGFGHLSN